MFADLVEKIINIFFNTFWSHRRQNRLHSFRPCDFIELTTTIDPSQLQNKRKPELRITLHEGLNF